MDKKSTALIAAVAVLVVAMIGMTWLLISQKKETSEIEKLYELEKQDLEKEYSQFVTQYDELKITITNDSLGRLLEEEQLKTQRLLEELRTVKSSNGAEIRRLKKELATVREVMKSYIMQIDSLNQVTEEQKRVIADVTQKYQTATQRAEALSQQKEDLDKQVTLAAQLGATNIRIDPKNKRDKSAKKVKDVTRLDIGFSITKNITAPTGERTLYIRITKPDNDVLTKDPGNTFNYENRTLPYSIKKYIEYTGEEQYVTVYWNVENAFLFAGTYRVDIFAENTLIGSQQFTLN